MRSLGSSIFSGGTFSRVFGSGSNFSQTLRSPVTSRVGGSRKLTVPRAQCVGSAVYWPLPPLRGALKFSLAAAPAAVAAAKYVFEGSERWGGSGAILENTQKGRPSHSPYSVFSWVVGRWEIDAGEEERKRAKGTSVRTICESEEAKMIFAQGNNRKERCVLHPSAEERNERWN